ncbi:T9SS type B sorting domain-containing protein [Flavobacterium sp. DG1-102-2]|uniref:T9SS type B sorting domain-containing protein n=1 Tax=Flavobacterium sp. DG1-102-2 TaxID=3081663 RepID=UPI00294A2322|nr:T9SS type B sorting domain-containing protein [Flavobacterium sp. DG1-102-2]MDV6167500.1 T9SS type B sorting domain-containing protein [Flavobacterium sp. DG1-102-2]
MHYIKFYKFRIVILLGLLLSCLSAVAQTPVPPAFAPRLQGGNIKVKGDVVFVGNNMLNKATIGIPAEANTPYNGGSDNNDFNMEYIDIDNDPNTFSSSSADLALTGSCTKVVYAGLYWASAYPYERSTNKDAEWTASDATRHSDYNQVKYKLPGAAAYTNITADNIIFDGKSTGPLNQSYKNAPIICYKNVTSMVQGLADPNGTYTFANLRAARGRRVGSSSAGWVMVVIFENPTMPSKFISTFDGYAGVSGTTTATINVNGFVTLPFDLPVNVKLGVGALEGDINIKGDKLEVKGNLTANYTNVGGGTNSLNPTNNFFNGSITNNNTPVTSRVPNSSNTLGFDLDLITLANGSKDIIKNSETGASLKLTTSNDTYGAFLATFAVDIIEPNIKLVKTVRNTAGTDISGQNVTLNSTLDYIITFDNIGNDDAKNFTIKDILPANTTFVSVDMGDITAAQGSYVYNPATRTVTFTIANSLVQKDELSVPHTIKLRVKVAESCNELTDACSNLIKNLAYATYAGVINTNVISEDPSAAGQTSCGIPIDGPANFLVDVSACVYARTEVICNGSVLLKGANGYGTYQWYLKTPNGDLPLATTKDYTAVTPGEYYYTATPIAPCIVPITENITVNDFINNSMTNPVIPVANETVQCPNNGIMLPKIFLCGSNDSKYIPTGINSGTVKWQRLNTACNTVPANCPHNACPASNWTDMFTGPNYTVTQAGEYRIYYDPNGTGACPIYFYFNVYKNNFDPLISSKDIVCTSNGEIKVVNASADYQIRLINQTTGAVLVDYPNTNPVFPIMAQGAYTIEMKQMGVPFGCTFTVKDITILNRPISANVITVNKTCNLNGSIRIQAYNVDPQYTFSVTNTTTGVTITHGPYFDNNLLFSGLNPGTYDVKVTTQDGCLYESTTTILDYSNITLGASVQQSINCDPGIIKLAASGGKAPYSYAIHSINGVLQNPAPGDYLPEETYYVTNAGTYVFASTDANGCVTLSNPVTISTITPTVTSSKVDATCSGINNGKITVSATGTGITYELLNSANVVIATNSTGIFPNLAPGNYKVNVIQTGTTTTCRYPYDFTIGQPNPIIVPAPVKTQDYTCLTTATIEITGVPTGGTAPYEYSINGTTFTGSKVFTGLTAGTYTITVKDVNGCTGTSSSVTITAPAPVTNITFTNSGPVTCTNATTTVTATAVGGQSPYTYEITAPASAVASNTDGIFAGLAPGTYTFNVTDAKGCTNTTVKTYTVNPAVKISLTASKVADVKCFGASDGSLTFTPANYTPSYNYTVTGGPTTVPAGNGITSGAAVVINNLAAGTYTVTVTSPSTGCTDFETVTIAAPPSALAATPNPTDATCNTPGSVVIAATGGWGGYTYAITLPATAAASNTTGTFNNLAAGSYTVVITDSKGCSITRTFTMSSAVAPELNLSAGGDYCIDATPTSVTVTITTATGMAPFQYKLDNGSYGAPTASTTATFSPLGTGTHTITVKDANGCEDSVTTTVSIAPQLTATATFVKGLDCTASPNAQIKVTVGGGTLNYQYQVSVNGGSYGALTALTPANGTVINYSAAAAGTYKFRITAANSCVVESNTITIAPITPPSFTLTPTDVICFGTSTGAITVNVNTAFGAGPFVTSVNKTDAPTASFGTQTSGLPAGNYTVRLTDANGCFTDVTTVINPGTPVTATVTKMDIQCIVDPNDITNNISAGSITISAASGGSGSYTYKVSNNFTFNESTPTTVDGSTPYAFTILSFGIYYVEVIDDKGCSYTETVIMASPPGVLTITPTVLSTDCATGGTVSVKVNASVPSATYTFGIFDQSSEPFSSAFYPPDAPSTDTKVFTNLTPGVEYTFVVYDSTTDCYSFGSVLIQNVTPTNLTVTTTPHNVTCPIVYPAGVGTGDGSVSFTYNGYGGTSVRYQIFAEQTNTPIGSPVTVTGLTSGPVTVNNFGSLDPGNYYISFTELDGPNVGCSKASASFQISQSGTTVVASASVTKNDNCGTNAGIIEGSAQFGTSPYEYQLLASTAPAPTAATWAGVSSPVFNAEGGITYIVYVKDANGCIKPSPAVLLPTDVSPQVAAAVDVECNPTEGQFVINVSRIAATGNVGPYTYSINDGTTSSAFESQPDSFQYMGLISGTYIVTIKDGNGCTFDAPAVTIYPPVEVTAEPGDQPTCGNSDGTIVAVGAGGSGSVNYRYSLSGDATVAQQPSGTFTGLPYGDFVVTITDVTGTAPYCTAQVAVSLEQPIAIDPTTTTAAATDVSCFGGDNGTITVTLGAGNTDIPYEYTLTGTLTNSTVVTPVIQTTPVFESLEAGTYTVTVASGKGCTLPITGIIIDQPDELLASASATPFECDADNDVTVSTITVTATDGTGPYFYSIDGGANYQSEATFEVADTGVAQPITIDVKDDHGCTTQATVTLQPLPVMITPTADLTTPLDCANAGTITVEIDGGSGDYTFEMLPSGPSHAPGLGAVNQTQDFPITEPGTYTFMVTDNVTHCTRTVTADEILEYQLIEAEATASTQVDCFGSATGTVTIDIANYTDTYTYDVYEVGNATPIRQVTVPVMAGTPLVISGLPAGNLFVTVNSEDSPFCSTDTNIITVASPAEALTVTASQTGSVTCALNMGEIIAEADGGWGDYEYELVNTTTGTTIQAFDPNNIFSGLTAGDYTVTARDSSGCTTAAFPVNLPVVPLITGTITAVPSVLVCNGDTTSTVSANASGGQGIYEYVLNTYDAAGTTIVDTTGLQVSNAFDNLGAGTYSITVTDNWSCSFTTATVTVTQPDALQGNLSMVKSLTCTTTGELSLSATGGTQPYRYSADGGTTYSAPFTTATPVLITGLNAGVYEYTIVDAANCETVLTNQVEILAVPALDLNLDLTAAEVSCSGGSNAAIIADAIGGLGNYQYQLLDGASNPIGTATTDGTFLNLAIGTYYVRVDSGDCNTTSAPIVITEPTPLQVSSVVTDIVCFGDVNGTISVTGTGGTGVIQYAIALRDATPPQTLQQFDTVHYWTDLESGIYDVIVQDENGCFELLELEVKMPDPITAQIVKVTDETCLGEGDATIEVTIIGGTGTYVISTDNINFTPVPSPGVGLPTSYLLTGLDSGLTTIYVKDQNECFLSPPISAPILPGVNMDPQVVVTPTCVANAPNSDITISIEGTVDTANVMYAIDAVNAGAYQSSNVFTNVSLAPGNYIAYARHIVPATGLTCIQEEPFTIDVHDPITANITDVVNVLCHADLTGEITVTANGGTGTLQYAIADADVLPLAYGTPQTTGVFGGLTVGNYSIMITDDISCEVVLTHTITEPAAALTATVTHTDEICINANDGTITVTPADGTGPYEVNLNGTGFTAPDAGPFDFTALADGTYTIEVRDANGCTFTAPDQTIAPGVDLMASIDAVQVCDETTITVTVNPAEAANVTYYLDGVLQPSNVIVANSLTPGNHTITVTHTNTCSASFNFTVAPVIPIVAGGTSQTDVLCFGDATGTATVTVTGGTGTLEFAIADANALPLVYSAYQTSNTFTGLAFGDYIINVTDELGCELASTTITVGQPAAALTATAAHTDEICINANDGTITVTPTDGTGPYEVSINGGGFTAPAPAPIVISNLADGTYTIDVRDANGCTVTAPDQTIAPGVDLMVSIDAVQVCDETTITVTVNPAEAANVTYYLDGVLQPSNVIVANGLTPTTHNITVVHTNTCSSPQLPFTVAPVIPIVAAGTSETDVLCFGDATGTAAVTVTGGTGTLEYAIADANALPLVYSAYQASNTFTGLAQGDYIINAKDELGCELASTTITVGQPAAALAATATHTDEICINANDGTITVTPTDGTAPYRARINGGAYSAASSAPIVFNTLADGTYTVEVIDANGCTFTAPSQTIAPGFDLMASINVAQVCDTATITVSVNPAVASSVTYYLDGALQSSNVIVATGLTPSPAQHEIRVLHSNGCESLLNFEVYPIIPIVVSAATITVTPVACHGQNSGSIQVGATGGTGQLQYALTWNIWPTPIYGPVNTFNNLLAGTYKVWVKDAMGCVVSVTDVIIDEPAVALSATATSTPEVCVNSHNGTITITPAGGTAPYSTAINSPINFQQDVFTYSGLFGGTYDVFVRDARGCYFKTTVVVEKGVNLNPYIQTTLSCNNNVPVNTVTVLLNPVVQNVEYRIPGVQDTFAANNTFDLLPGTYTVTVRHQNGCEKALTFTVQPRPAIVPTATAVDAKCNGEANGSITASATGGTGALKYGISPDYVMVTNPVFNNLAAGTYTIRVEDAYGCYEEVQATVGQPDAIVITVEEVLEEVCVNDDNGAIEISITGGSAPYATSLDANGPFVNDQLLFANLDGGVIYTIYVRDAKGCITTLDVPLAAPLDINATANVVYHCDSDTVFNEVTITTTGGINTSDLTYTLEGPAGTQAPQASNVFTNLEDGAYTVEVLHTSGCSDTVDFTIESVPALALSLSPSGLNRFTATVTGGKGPYTYALNDGDMGTKNTFTYEASGTYTVTVRDSRGCELTVAIDVIFIDIIIPDVVSPEGNGNNDTWAPGNTQNYPNINTDIFDRYGRKLATLRQGQSWDCRYEGSEMPSGDYWYLIKLGDAEGREFVGHFVIYR